MCQEAREFLSRHGITYDSVDVEQRPVGAEETMEVVQGGRRFYAKVGGEILSWDRDRQPVPDEELRRAFVHADGLMRIPILITGPIIIRGFHEETFATVLLPPGG